MLLLNFSPFPSLSTKRLDLRRISDQDEEEIFFLRSDEEMLQFLDRDPAKSIDQARQWIRMINDGTDNNQYITWGMALKNDPKLIGTITFWNVQKEHYRAEIGYALHSKVQGKGLMQEAMTIVLDYGFNTMKLHSVEANVNPANERSIRLLEKNGFVREAYHRENYYYNGRFLDSVIYSLIDPFDKTDLGRPQ
jgi:RimJ/RimL family protein N-acetyltransferase